MKTIYHQPSLPPFAGIQRRHPTLMVILTLVLAAIAITSLLCQDQATVILYQAF